MAKETAEQKLLKALQKKAASTSTSPSKKSSSIKDFKFSFSIFAINRVLIVGIVLCVIFFVYQLRSGMALLNKQLNFAEDIKATPRLDESILPRNKDVKYYIDSFGNRNIFRPYD